MIGNEGWKKNISALIDYNCHNLAYYESFATAESDREIHMFVLSNIDQMTSVYRIGVIICIQALAGLVFLKTGRSLVRLSGLARARALTGLLNRFPFELLNRLVCGNVFMRLFELAPGQRIR